MLKTKWQRHVDLKPDEGTYRDMVFGEHMILLSGVSYRAFYERLWDILSTGAVTLFYEIGYELGKDVMTELKRRYRDPTKIFSIGTNHYFFVGMGRIEFNLLQLLRMASTGTATIRITNSYPALAIGKTGRAECHLTRGYIVGGVEVLTRKRWTCEETQCLCKNDPYCEFKLNMVSETSGQRAWRKWKKLAQPNL